MPYSEATLLRQAKEKYIKKVTKEIVTTAKKALDTTAEELYKETFQIFDKCIDQFYAYETRRYYRHETGRGTGTGMNLYRASQFRLQYDSEGHAKSLHIGWNANDMAPYKSWKDKNGNYHHVSADYVLNNVMNGIRGLEDEYVENGFAPYNNHWSVNNLETKNKYFGTLSGTPNEIFSDIEKQWKSVSRGLFQKYFNNYIGS